MFTNMPWVSVTPAVHKVLGHSWELIELNSCYGSGALDESGTEDCQKVLRNLRINLSRKQTSRPTWQIPFVCCGAPMIQQLTRRGRKVYPCARNALCGVILAATVDSSDNISGQQTFFILCLIFEYKNFVIFLEYKRQYLFMDYSIFKALF